MGSVSALHHMSTTEPTQVLTPAQQSSLPMEPSPASGLTTLDFSLLPEPDPLTSHFVRSPMLLRRHLSYFALMSQLSPPWPRLNLNTVGAQSTRRRREGSMEELLVLCGFVSMVVGPGSPAALVQPT